MVDFGMALRLKRAQDEVERQRVRIIELEGALSIAYGAMASWCSSEWINSLEAKAVKAVLYPEPAVKETT